MLRELLTTDHAPNTPKARARSTICAEALAHSFRVLFFVALRYLSQMPLATCVTNGGVCRTTCRRAKTGGFTRGVSKLVLLEFAKSMVLGSITIPITPDQVHWQPRFHLDRRLRIPNMMTT